MTIYYRDHLGYVKEKVDEYGISFCDGYVYFNDKKIGVQYIEQIVKED